MAATLVEERVTRGRDRRTVGVIVPMYNAAETITETLVSIAAQSYQDLDIVVVDDGSSDGSVAVVENLIAQGLPVRLTRQENSGVAAARNRGAAATSADYLAFVDADDLWAPEKVAAQMAALDGSPAAVVYCWFAQIDSSSRAYQVGQARVYEGDVLKALCRENFVGNGSSLLMHREVFDAVGGFDTRLRDRAAQGCEDYMFLLKAAMRYPFILVPRHLVGYRITHSNMSSNVEQMLRSFEMVAKELAEELSQFALDLRENHRDFLVYLGRRAAMAGRLRQARLLVQRLRREHGMRPSDIVPDLLRVYTRAKIIPRWAKTAAERSGLSAVRLTYQKLSW